MCGMPCYVSLERKPNLLAMSNFMFVPAIGLLISTIPTHAITVFYCMWYSFVTTHPRPCDRTEQAFPCVPITFASSCMAVPVCNAAHERRRTYLPAAAGRVIAL